MFRKQDRVLWLMGLITLFGLPIIAWPIIWVQNLDLKMIFYFESSLFGSLFLMISIGLFFGLAMIFLTEIPFFDKALSQIRNRLINFKLTTFFVFFLAAAAGIGEEILFRAALQPMTGIFLTSFVFVAIHGYFSFNNMAINYFGCLLFLFICLIGYSASEYSIWHAIGAHFSYDLVLLFYYKNLQQNDS